MDTDSNDLAGRRCEPCHSGTPRLEGSRVREFEAKLDDRWSVVDERRLETTVDFPDFLSALAFVNRAGGVAEAEGHHPELTLAWGRVEVRIWTHAIDGLSENDFILAAKYDEIREG